MTSLDTDLRDLDAGDAKKRDRALTRLWGSLCNQGSVEPESLAAVHPLAATLASPGARSRAEVIELLVGIAIGNHENFLDGALAPNRPRKRPTKPAKSLEGKCFDAVAKELAAVRSLLGDRDAGVRAAAAFALAWFPDPRGRSTSELRARASVEREPAVRASVLLSLGHLADERSRDALGRALEERDPIVRGAALIATVYLGGKRAPAALRDALAATAQTTSLARTKQPWNGGDLAGHAKIVLASLPLPKSRRLARGTEAWMVDQLRRISYVKGQALAAEWVPKLFPGSARRSQKTLTESQRLFLTMLMTEGIGTPGSALDQNLRAHGLPTIERLPAWIGVPRGMHRDYHRR